MNDISSINAMLYRISANDHVNNEDINEVISTIEKLFTSSAQLTIGPKYKHDNNKIDNTKKNGGSMQNVPKRGTHVIK